MGTGPSFRPEVRAAQKRLAEGHRQFRERHRTGCGGVALCRQISALRDGVILDLFEAALADLEAAAPKLAEDKIALVAHGGSGRRQVAPYSDVDLMLLCGRGTGGQIAPAARRLTHDLFDANLTVGHSVRTVREACRLACRDTMICTSLVDSRLLAGSRRLYEQYVHAFRRSVRRRAHCLLGEVEKARRQERAKYGQTVFLLEPNVKRSEGGLRDLQWIRWIGLIRYGTPEPEGLRDAGVLSDDDCLAIEEATEFLLWLRNELHFHADKPNDVLDRAEQLRIAELKGYKPAPGMLPVERFMRDYFRHTSLVSHLAGRLAAEARSERPLRRLARHLFGHRVGRDFLVGPHEVSLTRQGAARLGRDLASVVRLADLANLYDMAIAPATWSAIRRAAATMGDEISPEARKHFLSLISHPARPGRLLRGLHEAGLLERFIPAFTHARGLLQFNQYHKFTVDEHCLQAVEQATEFLHDDGPLGRVYRQIKRKHILHLALLVHDLGKGYCEDHTEVGRRIAEQTAKRLGLSEGESEAFAFLVHKHQLMSHLAFRRDTDDESLVVRFAATVGSPELLQMLYVMSAADLGAVGPGVLTTWKIDVLTGLYLRTLQHLAGDGPMLAKEEKLERLRKSLGSEADNPWFCRQLDALPPAYLTATAPGRIADDLKLLYRLAEGEAVAQGRYEAQTHTVQYTVGTRENIAPGVFHRLTGALAGHGLEILSAEINTLADGVVVDRFWVRDPDYPAEPPPQRRKQVERALVESLHSRAAKKPVFRRIRRIGEHRQPTVSTTATTRVEVDNSTSARFTILDVFSADRPGLLYAIASALFEMGLSVWRAKIGTYLDQVVDVFYVTDQEDTKIEDDLRLQQIRQRLWEAIASLDRAPR